MKKVLSLILLAVMLAVISSCSNLENDAKKHLKMMIQDVAKNPDTFKIRNEKIVVSNDSLCIIEFNGLGENSFGGHINKKMEYVYVRDPKNDNGECKYFENIGDIEGGNSVTEYFNLLSSGNCSEEDKALITHFSTTLNISETDAISQIIFIRALAFCMLRGRAVNDN
ncbi:MAG: hypothetical protein ACI4B3_00605 [Prevotella sp.]